MVLFADSESPSQTARMRRLIRAFAVRICPKTRFCLVRPSVYQRYQRMDVREPQHETWVRVRNIQMNEKYAKVWIAKKKSFFFAVPRSEKLLTCTQGRLKSAYASAQFDLSLCSSYEETLHPWLSKMCPTRILISLRERAGWSESSLGT